MTFVNILLFLFVFKLYFIYYMSDIRYKEPKIWLITATENKTREKEVIGYVKTEQEAQIYIELLKKERRSMNLDLEYYQDNYSDFKIEETHKILIKY